MKYKLMFWIATVIAVAAIGYIVYQNRARLFGANTGTDSAETTLNRMKAA